MRGWWRSSPRRARGRRQRRWRVCGAWRLRSRECGFRPRAPGLAHALACPRREDEAQAVEPSPGSEVPPPAARAYPSGAPKERGCKVDAPAARLLGARGRVLPAEFVHAARGVDDLLLARIERMAVRAHLDLQIVTEGRARLERVAARAGDGDLSVVGVDCGFHGRLTLSQKAYPEMGCRGRRLKGARV